MEDSKIRGGVKKLVALALKKKKYGAFRATYIFIYLQAQMKSFFST